jgi:uncharacterized protein involved in exopolysaccharide biosynthesis
MTEAKRQDDEEVSLVALGTTLLRNRWRIARWMFVGAVIAVLPVLSKPLLYSASASFVPQGTDQNRSGIAGLAGQFGMAFFGANQSQSPEFYSGLLKSRELLAPIARSTFVMQEMNGKRISFLDLFEIEGESAQRREEQGVELLTQITTTSVVKTTGVVELSVATRWPSVSLAIATALVDGVNVFNQRTRQGQAAAERRFLEGRLAVARVDLRAAEDKLELFLKTNRAFANSPQLTFDRERLGRDLSLQQQVYTSLTQSYEDARIREVRDTPVITVIEPPTVSTRPFARGRAKRGLLGLLLGGLLGAVVAFTSETMARRRGVGDADVEALVGTLGELKSEVAGAIRYVRARLGR